MSQTLLELAQERLEWYLAAERQCLTALRYKHGDNEVERAKLSEIQAEITKLKTEISLLSSPTSGDSKAVVILMRRRGNCG